MKRKCQRCNTLFAPESDERFCPDCAEVMTPPPVEITSNAEAKSICPECGDEFVKHSARQKYCSSICSNRVVNRRAKEKYYASRAKEEVSDDSKPIRTIEEAINPDHYKIGGIEAIDVLKAKLTAEEFEGYLKGTLMKYIMRAGHKDIKLQDYKKAKWFMDRLVSETEGAIGEQN